MDLRRFGDGSKRKRRIANGDHWTRHCRGRRLLYPQAAYQWWKATKEGVVLLRGRGSRDGFTEEVWLEGS
jgi:hypothetical protein